MRRYIIFILFLSLIFILTGCNQKDTEEGFGVWDNVFYSIYQGREGLFFQIINENEEDVVLEFDSDLRYEFEVLDIATDEVMWRLSDYVPYEKYNGVEKVTIPAKGEISEKIDMALINQWFSGEIKVSVYSTAKNIEYLSPLKSFINLGKMSYINNEIVPVKDGFETLKIEKLNEEDKLWVEEEIEKNKNEVNSVEESKILISVKKNEDGSLIYIEGKEGIKLSFKGLEEDNENLYVKIAAGERYKEDYILIKVNTDKTVVPNIIEE